VRLLKNDEAGNRPVRKEVVVTYSYNKTNETHYFLKLIVGIELYMFRTGFLSIIMSLVHTA
jgi:hypothetical protein